MKSLKEFIKKLELPKQEDYIHLTPATHNYIMAAWKNLCENEMFTEKYIQLQTVYRFFLSQFLLQTTKMDVIDRKLKQHELSFLENRSENMNFYQRNDLMGLDYFYLRNHIHIERLEEEQLKLLEGLLDKVTEENAKEAKVLIENTYKKVLGFAEDDSFQEIELFPSIYGEGNIPVDAIVFMIAAVPEYDEAGNIKDVTAQEKKENILLSLKAQLEPMWSVALKVPVKIFVE